MSQRHICLPSGVDGIRTALGGGPQTAHLGPSSNTSAKVTQMSSLVGVPIH